MGTTDSTIKQILYWQKVFAPLESSGFAGPEDYSGEADSPVPLLEMGLSPASQTPVPPGGFVSG